MGLFDKLRGELVDIIEWIDDSRHTLVWRFPRYHNEIKNGAQLIVRPGQVAVFVHRGQIADVFEPGSYDAQDRQPADPQHARGLEVRLRQPVQGRGLLRQHAADHRPEVGHAEPDHAARPRVRPGPPARVRHLHAAGGRPEGAAQGAGRHRSALRGGRDHRAVARRSSRGVRRRDRARRRSRRSTSPRTTASSRSSCASSCASGSTTSTGSRSRSSFIVNISLPEEVEQALDTRSEHGRDRRHEPLPAVPDGQGDARGRPKSRRRGAAEGMGLGMGFAMANRMTRSGGIRRPRPRRPLAVPPGTSPSAASPKGPMSLEQLAEGIARGKITPTTPVWTAGMPAWTPAARMPQLPDTSPACLRLHRRHVIGAEDLRRGRASVARILAACGRLVSSNSRRARCPHCDARPGPQ